jgi:hypothetical protein
VPVHISFDGETRRMYNQPNVASPAMDEIVWDDSVAQALIIEMGSQELWQIYYPGVALPEQLSQ